MMKKSKFIIKLEEILDNSKEMTFEDAMRTIKRKNINNEFTKIFDGKEKISEEEIGEISTSSVVKGLLFLFARLNNIKIETKNSISISDLEDSVFYFYNPGSSVESLPKDKEEELLRTPSPNDKVKVIDSRINFVFSETLRYATDSEIFKELLSEGYASLVESVENYEPKKHESFDIYLSYNLNNALSNKLDELIGYRKQPLIRVNGIIKDDKKIIDDRAYIEELFDEADLTDAERATLDIEYGLFDAKKFSEEYLKQIGSLDIINSLSLQISAIEKIRQKKARK